MKKKLCILITVFIFVFIAGCSESKENDEVKESKEVDVMLDWYPNAVHSFLYVAQEKGYFEEEGIKVNIKFPSNTSDPLNLAAANKVTLGLYYQPDIIMAIANEDLPVKSLGAIVREPLNYLVFKEEQNIKTPKDLLNKKIGYPGIQINEALLKTMMKNVDEDPDSVDMIDVGFELGSAIITNNVDAVYGAFINHEVPVLQNEGYDIDYINPVDFGVPNYYELVFVTGDKTWESQQDEIESFFLAAQKGFDFMTENPDEALSILLENQDEANFPLERKIEEKSMEVLLPKMKNDEGLRNQEKTSWETTAKWLKEEALINDIPNIEKLFIP